MFRIFYTSTKKQNKLPTFFFLETWPYHLPLLLKTWVQRNTSILGGKEPNTVIDGDPH